MPFRVSWQSPLKSYPACRHRIPCGLMVGFSESGGAGDRKKVCCDAFRSSLAALDRASSEECGGAGASCGPQDRPGSTISGSRGVEVGRNATASRSAGGTPSPPMILATAAPKSCSRRPGGHCSGRCPEKRFSAAPPGWLSMATEKCTLLAIEKCTLFGRRRAGSEATGAGAPDGVRTPIMTLLPRPRRALRRRRGRPWGGWLWRAPCGVASGSCCPGC